MLQNKVFFMKVYWSCLRSIVLVFLFGTTLNLNAQVILKADTVICNGDSLLFGGNYIKNAGVYYDSIQTDTLTITQFTLSVANKVDNVNQMICPGTPYKLTIDSNDVEAFHWFKDEELRRLKGAGDKLPINVAGPVNYYIKTYCNASPVQYHLDAYELPELDGGDYVLSVIEEEVELIFPFKKIIDEYFVYNIVDEPILGTIDLINESWLFKCEEEDYFEDSIVIQVSNENCALDYDQAVFNIVRIPPPVVAPELFTPNGDGVNEFMVLTHLYLRPGSLVQVFNAWGAEVYQSNDYQNDWEGSYNKKVLPRGVYILSVDMPAISAIEREFIKTVVTIDY